MQTKLMYKLIRAIVVLLACNVAYLVCGEFDLPTWTTIRASIAFALIAQIALFEPLFDAYNLRRLTRNR